MEKIRVGYTDYAEHKSHYKTIDDIITLWALFSAEIFGEIKIICVHTDCPSISLPLEDFRSCVKKMWGKA